MSSRIPANATTEMWDVYYEEEKRNLEECLTRIMANTKQDFDDPIVSTTASKSSISPYDTARRKQLVIDALLQIRGRAQLKHEESLKKQQEALIMTVDNTIKKEAEKRKEEFFKSAEAYAASTYLQEIVRAFSVEYKIPDLASSRNYKPTFDDEQCISSCAHDTIIQIRQILEGYIARKRESAFQVMNAELQSICAPNAQSISLDEVKSKLQEDLKCLMTEATKNEENYWNAILAKNPQNKNMAASVKSLLALQKKNMQLAAQISVLNELKGK